MVLFRLLKTAVIAALKAQNAIQYVEEWPTLDGYGFKGEGWCTNSQGDWYSYETVGDGSSLTIQQCGEECIAKYASDTRFVGINFHPSWFGSTNCNCMMDLDGTLGEVSGGNGFNEEVCYGYLGVAEESWPCQKEEDEAEECASEECIRCFEEWDGSASVQDGFWCIPVKNCMTGPCANCYEEIDSSLRCGAWDFLDGVDYCDPLSQHSSNMTPPSTFGLRFFKLGPRQSLG